MLNWIYVHPILSFFLIGLAMYCIKEIVVSVLTTINNRMILKTAKNMNIGVVEDDDKGT